MKQTLYDPLYKLYLTVLFDKDPVKAKKIAEKEIGESLDDLNFNCDAKTIEYTSNNGGQRILLWVKQKKASVIAHEFIHVIRFCFERRRLGFGYDKDEFIAYYLEYLMNEFKNFY